MRIRGGGDPTKNHGSRAAVHSGPAAPELAADAHDCIMVRSSNDRPNTRLWRAIGATPMASSRLLQLAVSHATSNQVDSAMPRPTGADSRFIDAKCVAPSRRILPSCSRPSRTLRAASRWPEGGPSSDRRCARRRSERAAGTGEWLRRGRTKELEKEEMAEVKRINHLLTKNAPYKGPWYGLDSDRI